MYIVDKIGGLHIHRSPWCVYMFIYGFRGEEGIPKQLKLKTQNLLSFQDKFWDFKCRAPMDRWSPINTHKADGHLNQGALIAGHSSLGWESREFMMPFSLNDSSLMPSEIYTIKNHKKRCSNWPIWMSWEKVRRQMNILRGMRPHARSLNIFVKGCGSWQTFFLRIQEAITVLIQVRITISSKWGRREK